MTEGRCGVCGGPTEAGYVVTSNGSGLFWSHEPSSARLRPKGLEVLVGTSFGGTFSAHLAGSRCPACSTILLALPKKP